MAGFVWHKITNGALLHGISSGLPEFSARAHRGLGNASSMGSRVEGRDTNWILTEKQFIIRVKGFPYLLV
jgi:hypothetical protein